MRAKMMIGPASETIMWYVALNLGSKLSIRVPLRHSNGRHVVTSHQFEKFPTHDSQDRRGLRLRQPVEAQQLHYERLADAARHFRFVPAKTAYHLFWEASENPSQPRSLPLLSR